jgi:hypothetical protein
LKRNEVSLDVQSDISEDIAWGEERVFFCIIMKIERNKRDKAKGRNYARFTERKKKIQHREEICKSKESQNETNKKTKMKKAERQRVKREKKMEKTVKQKEIEKKTHPFSYI